MKFKIWVKYPLSLIFLCITMQGFAQFAWPNASAYNPNTNKYYITNNKGNNVVSIDSNNVKSVFISGLTAPNNILFDQLPIGSAFIVLDSNQVKAYDDTGGYFGIFTTTGAKKLQDAVFDKTNGILYISDPDRGMIYKTVFGSAPFFFPSTSIFSTPYRRPSAMVLQASKNRILYVEDTIGGNLMAISTTNGSFSKVKTLGMDGLVGLAEDGQGNLYISSQGLKGIYQLNKYYAGSPVKLYGEPKPGDITVNVAKDQWVYSCLICGSVFIPPLHLFGPGIEISGCADDSFHCYKNSLMHNIGTFEKGNQFIMELSNKSGKFTNPIQLATISDTLIPNEMDGIIPSDLNSGTGYRLRWRSTKPAIMGKLDLFEIYARPPAHAAASDTVQGCSGNPVKLGLGNPTDTQYHYKWLPANEVDTANKPTANSIANKNKWIYLTVKNTEGCITKDSAFIKPVSTPYAGNLDDTIKVCTGAEAKLGGAVQSGLKYSWSPGKYLNDSSSPNPVFIPTKSIRFHLIVSASGGCFSKDSQTVALLPNPVFTLPYDSIKLCYTQQQMLGVSGDTIHFHYLWINKLNIDTTFATYKKFSYADSGIYKIVGINNKTGCFAEKPFSVNSLPVINPYITQSKDTVLATVNLKYDIKWYKNSAPTGDTTKTLIAKSSGFYYAGGIVKTGCREYTNFVTVTINTTGLAQNTKDIECRIYPVPVTNEITIQCNNLTKITWEIIKPDGSHVQSGLGETIPVEQLKPGIYFLKINQTTMTKFIKN